MEVFTKRDKQMQTEIKYYKVKPELKVWYNETHPITNQNTVITQTHRKITAHLSALGRTLALRRSGSVPEQAHVSHIG